MKLLFASLSRIGDYLQHLVILRAIQSQNPNFEIHLLVNDLIPKDLMRMNEQFSHIVLPRFELQKQINKQGTPLLYPFFSLRRLVEQLKAEKYDQVHDLSFQSHSIAFLKLVKPDFSYSTDEIIMINQFSNKNDSSHLIDKLKSLYDLEIAPDASFGKSAKRLVLQVTTSDIKKSIDLSRWRNLLTALRFDQPNIEIFVIGSHSEFAILNQIFNKNEIISCSFTELSHLLDAETRLISLDTSIKHFATQFKVPTLEISVGSSHWLKNAAYQTGNYIFSADFHCRPCAHSSACPLVRNQCQDQIDFSDLKAFINDWIIAVNPSQFPMITKNSNTNLVIQRGEKWNRKINHISPYL